MENNKTGQRIKRARDKKAWTQEHLAGVAGVSVRTIQRAEEGAMSAESLTALAAALDVSVESLTKSDSGYPSISPILFYDDPKTLDWLVEILGFEVRMKYEGPNGKIMHAELTFGDSLIMVGAPAKESKWVTPSTLDGLMTGCLHLMVDDVDEHFARAKKAGARILSEPENGYGQRRYRLVDPEGHLWSVATAVDA